MIPLRPHGDEDEGHEAVAHKDEIEAELIVVLLLLLLLLLLDLRLLLGQVLLRLVEDAAHQRGEEPHYSLGGRRAAREARRARDPATRDGGEAAREPRARGAS